MNFNHRIKKYLGLAMFVFVQMFAYSLYAAEEFPPLPLKPKIPDNVAPMNQKYPPTYKKAFKMALPPNMVREDLDRLIVPNLSNACVNNKFNQIRKGLNYVTLPRKGGGIYRYEAASTEDGNLLDPKRLGNKTMLYLFEKDKTSECIVYSIPYFDR